MTFVYQRLRNRCTLIVLARVACRLQAKACNKAIAHQSQRWLMQAQRLHGQISELSIRLDRAEAASAVAHVATRYRN